MVEDFFEIKINKNGYPKGLANFEILNFSIPQHYKNKIIDHLMMFHKKKTIFETLKYFINSFEKIYEKSKSKL